MATKRNAKKRAGKKAEAKSNKPLVEAKAVPEEVKAPEKRLRPSGCRAFMRKRLAEEFPKIVDGFVKEATTGSCAHVKLASELLEKTPVKRVSRRKGPAERMVEELRSQTVEGRQ